MGRLLNDVVSDKKIRSRAIAFDAGKYEQDVRNDQCKYLGHVYRYELCI